ncbi:hypothetical protein FA15DRAFT_557972, partial [Coprinopsis marcescibilis]
AAKYFQIAAFVMLIYDHALTFGQEVERVWKQQFSGVTLLFLLNRYLTPLQFIIIIEAFHDPQWSKEVPYYLSSPQATANLNRFRPAPLPPGLVGQLTSCVHACLPRPPTTCRAASLWVAPLVTDTFIFLLTLARTRTYNKLINTAPTLQVFLRDGSLYFLIIFLANLMNTVIYFVTPEDLKAIGASFSHLITTTIVSRLVLNLRSL